MLKFIVFEKEFFKLQFTPPPPLGVFSIKINLYFSSVNALYNDKNFT